MTGSVSPDPGLGNAQQELNRHTSLPEGRLEARHVLTLSTSITPKTPGRGNLLPN